MSDPFDEVVTELANTKEPLCVTAAAGCGKTEAIARAVKQSEGKQLILTHTNAGVAALRSRLRRYSVPESKYCVETIASWLLKYVGAYPSMSGFRNSHPMGDEWKGVYPAAGDLFSHSFVRDVLRASYAGAFVDEYQDCTKQQHSIVLKMCEYLPVRVLGDPLQGIFGFQADPLVDWPADVKGNFKSLPDLDFPYRWERTDKHPNANPPLGTQLTEVRRRLLAEESVDLNEFSEIRWQPWSEQQERVICQEALNRVGTIAGIHQWLGDDHSTARGMGGVYQSIEEMDCKDLMKTSRKIDEQCKRGNYQAVVNCIKTFILLGCGNRAPFSNADYLRNEFSKLQQGNFSVISDIMRAIIKDRGMQVYRCELFAEMARAVQEFSTGEYNSFEEAAYAARCKTRLNGRKLENCIISRTLLIKGLEFDHAIVLKAHKLQNRENLYVAITRGSQSLTVLSDSSVIYPLKHFDPRPYQSI